MINYPIQEHEHSINGVQGRMNTIHSPQKVRGRLVHRNQTWFSVTFIWPHVPYPEIGRACIRFDDECQNGHQTFSITTDVTTNESRKQCDIAAGDCLHDDIAKIFPELAPLIKWHLFSTDGPMHYLANTVYLAGNRDYFGRAKGEPDAWKTVVYFANSPVSHKSSSKMRAFIEEHPSPRVLEIQHQDNDKPGSFKFKPKYTFEGFCDKWHECPFDDKVTAEEWASAFSSGDYHFDRIVTGYSEGKERDLDAARRSACWPEATDEELMAEPEELKKKLTARLPTLIADFRKEMESIGFLWEPEQEEK